MPWRMVVPWQSVVWRIRPSGFRFRQSRGEGHVMVNVVGLGINIIYVTYCSSSKRNSTTHVPTLFGSLLPMP